MLLSSFLSFLSSSLSDFLLHLLLSRSTVDSVAVERLEQIMIWLSFIINIFLVIAKLLALIWSGSLSIFASFLDSILDLLSGSIIFVANRLIAHDDPYKYPIGLSPLFAFFVLVIHIVREKTDRSSLSRCFLSGNVCCNWAGLSSPSLSLFASSSPRLF